MLQSLLTSELSSKCQVEFAHIHLFLNSSPEIAFLCPWDVPSMCIARGNQSTSMSRVLLSSPGLAARPFASSPKSSSLLSFCVHPSLLRTSLYLSRHWKLDCPASFNSEGHGRTSPTPCILLLPSGRAEGEPCLSPG